MAVKTSSKELDALQKQFKYGYTLKRTGGGHYRVYNGQGVLVEDREGKALTISSQKVGAAVRSDLRAAGVLRGTAPVQRAKPSAAQRAARAERLRKAVRERNRERQAEADALRERLVRVLGPVGGAEADGVQSDLAAIGSLLSRRNGGEKVLTPDLLYPAIYRVLHNNGWVQTTPLWNQLLDELEQAEDVREHFFALVREAKGLPEQVVVQTDRKGTLAEADWPFEMQLLDIAALFADHSYQRPPDWPFVRRGAATFDERLVGAIDVSKRGRGATFAILDGQQRMEMMKLAGKTTVWAAVYSGFDVQEEARFFLHKNKDKKAIHPYYTYKARLTSGDEQIIAITKIVESFGFRVSITSAAHDERNISAISALEDVHRRKNDVYPNCLTPTLRTLKAATFGLESGQNANIIRGVGFFHEWFPEDVDQRRLEERIAARGPLWLLSKARENTLNNTLMGAVTRAIVEEYNRGIGRQGRLNASILPTGGGTRR